MKFRYEIEIDAGLDTVWEAFGDADRRRHWQPTLKERIHMAGEPGRPGSVTELVFEENGRRIAMTETITERREPDFMAAQYATGSARTLVVTTFEASGAARTRLTSWSNTHFTGMTRYFWPLFRRKARSRIQADYQRFKLMVETDAAGDGS